MNNFKKRYEIKIFARLDYQRQQCKFITDYCKVLRHDNQEKQHFFRTDWGD